MQKIGRVIVVVKRIFLTEDKGAYIDAYIADKIASFTRKAILVIPGGGYHAVCSDREGEPIAQAFMPYGYNAFVLHYTTSPKGAFPKQLIEASLAVKHIKDFCGEYGINPEEIFAVGFSAGGHLAACLGTMWHKKEVYEEAQMPFGYNKIRGMMLIYPVISSKYHKSSLENLLCKENADEKEFERVDVENSVDERSVPFYLLHTANDDVVDIRNALVMAEAYSKMGKSFEMHIYPDAPHGVALANKITKCGVSKWENQSIAEWVKQATCWADNLVENK